MSIIGRILGRDSQNEADTAKQMTEHKAEKKRVIGRIIRVDSKGWGFISSREIPFTRIFFHWSALNKDTLHFTALEKGMFVEFEPIEYEDQGWRAIKIIVLPDYMESKDA